MPDALRLNKRSSGFTLLEMVVAIALLIGGVLVVYGTSARMLAHIYNNQNRLVAAYLAQEGVEVVRNIRDQNWADGIDWRDGLGDGTYRVQYNSSALLSSANVPLKLNNGYYQYDSGGNTPFSRQVAINTAGEDAMRILVTVGWPHDQGNPVQVETFLYDWR